MNPSLVRKTLFPVILGLTVVIGSACSGGDGNGKSGGGAAATPAPTQSDYSKPVQLIGASASGTEKLYAELDDSFSQDWKTRTGQQVTVDRTTDEGAALGKAIEDGSVKADVAVLGVGIDIDALQAKGLVGDGWQQRYDYNSSPFYTTVAFVVRSGNPKGIQNWDELVAGDAAVVTASPASESDARWYYAAPWAYSLNASPDDTEKAKAFVTSFHSKVAKLAIDDTEAEKLFVEQGIGDVLVTTESRALALAEGAGKGKVEAIVPAVTLAVEPVVSAIDKNADADGIREVADAYADFLFTEPAQLIAGNNGYRPRYQSVAEQFAGKFPEVTILTVDDNLTGWENLQAALFAEGGLFVQLPAKN